MRKTPAISCGLQLGALEWLFAWRDHFFVKRFEALQAHAVAHGDSLSKHGLDAMQPGGIEAEVIDR